MALLFARIIIGFTTTGFFCRTREEFFVLTKQEQSIFPTPVVTRA